MPLDPVVKPEDAAQVVHGDNGTGVTSREKGGSRVDDAAAGSMARQQIGNTPEGGMLTSTSPPQATHARAAQRVLCRGAC
jgi:hypothetical protein